MNNLPVDLINEIFIRMPFLRANNLALVNSYMYNSFSNYLQRYSLDFKALALIKRLFSNNNDKKVVIPKDKYDALTILFTALIELEDMDVGIITTIYSGKKIDIFNNWIMNNFKNYKVKVPNSIDISTIEIYNKQLPFNCTLKCFGQCIHYSNNNNDKTELINFGCTTIVIIKCIITNDKKKFIFTRYDEVINFIFMKFTGCNGSFKINLRFKEELSINYKDFIAMVLRQQCIYIRWI